MKKKIIIGLALCAISFLLGGLYILLIIDRTTDKLDNLIMLHQVEILREHYLIQLRRVQTDLTVRDTKFARDFNTVVGHVANMGRVVGTCFDCHHESDVAARLRDLRNETRQYEESLSRVLTVRGEPARMALERDAAFRLGEGLIEKVSDMIALTGARLEASTARSLKEIAATKRVLVALLAAGPLALVALGYLLVRGLSKPLELLLAATRRLKGGDLDYRVTGLTDEFHELGSAFNDMSSAIKEQIATRERAERMAMLGQVSAGLAHEIKNPIAGIKAAMEVLTLEPNLPEEDKEVLRKVQKEAGRVEALMKTFLNFGRPPKPQPAQVDLNALVSSSLTLYARGPRNEGRTEEIKVVADLAPLPVVTTDPMQLEQVLINLVLNAFDAMPSGGTLSVRTGLAPAKDFALIEVADDGKGIPPERLEKIFTPFYTTKPKGTGLGLAISRQLMEQQGGSLTVTSTVGQGTTFTIRLPLASAEVA